MEICRVLTIFVLLTFQCVTRAQKEFSCQGITRGQKFVLAFTGNNQGDVRIIELFLLVVAFSDNPTTVTVSSKFQVNDVPFQETFHIQPRGFYRLSIPSDLVLDSTSERSNKVIEVDATSDVSVYGLNYAPFTTDAFLGIPVDHLGLNYVVMSYEGPNDSSLFAIVGVEDNTRVFATLTGAVTFNGDIYASGDILHFIVNQNEVVQIVSNSGLDFLGGSIVKSDKPVALFSGDLCISTPGSACDILSEQIVPVRSWGTTHFYTATGSSQGSSIYIVHAFYEDTVVNIPGLSAITLQPGELFERALTGSGVITTSQPSSVVQILRSISSVGVDPSLIQIPTESQFGYVFGFSTPPKAGGDGDGFFNFLNIIVKVNESSTVMLNNISINSLPGTSSHHIPETDYEVYIIQVPKGEGVYFVEQNSFQSTSPISVIVYGYEDYESYGYSAGLSLPSDERLLSIKPFFLREVGGDQLIVTLPCVKADIGHETSVTCRFHIYDEPIDVEGTFFDAYTVMCVAPIFPQVGFVTLEVSIDKKESFPFRGNVYVAPQHVLPPKLSVRQTGSPDAAIIDTTKSDDIISLNWSQDDFPNTEMVDVSAMFATMDEEGDKIEWSDEVNVIKGVLNTGTADVTSKEVSDAANLIFNEDSSITMIVFSVKRSPSRTKRNILGTLTSITARSAVRIFIPSVLGLATQCFAWQPVLMYTKVTNLPSCPCTSDQARADGGNFVSDEDSDLSFFHPGASSCYRSLNNDRSGQQCCYGSDGNILVGPPGGGTADVVAPDGISFSTVGHFFLDVVPYFACCKWSDDCDIYYENRPSDDCSNYEPPVPTRGTGDPHFTSLDGKEFTFNGAGEFLLLKSSLFNVTFQARMEILPGTNASVYSAFVMKSNSSDQIQVQRSASNETIVLINGLPFNLRQDGFIIRKQVRRGLHISLQTDLSEIYIRQQSGLSLSIRITDEMMSFILQLPDIFQNQVEGLLGNFNNDPNDDFMLPNGSFLSPNLTLQEIHYDFGLSWILDATTSLFTYIPPNGFLTFNKPSFKPTLTFPDPDEVSDDIKAVCGESKFCLFDAISTGSTHFAEETLHDLMTFDSIKNHSAKIVTCGFPGEVLNGVVNGSIYLVGYRLSVSCNEGFSLVGSDNLECGENGSWSDALPSCVSCPTPGTIPNVVIEGTNYDVGSVLLFSCVNDDYKLNGPLTVECQETGKWSSEFPECFKKGGFKYWILAVAIGCCLTVVVVVLVLPTVLVKRKRENLV